MFTKVECIAKANEKLSHRPSTTLVIAESFRKLLKHGFSLRAGWN
jgi:hypothetical protein